MRSNENILIGLTLVLYAILGFGMVFLGNIHTDESWWFYGSTLVAKGEHPHFDFVSHHNPIFYYLYAIPQYFFGNSFIAARLTSLFFSLLTLMVTLRMTVRKAGRSGLLLAAGLFLSNLFVLYCYTIVHYQALETLVLMLIATVVFGKKTSVQKAFWISLLGVILIGIRYPIELIPLLFFFYLAWLLFCYPKHPPFSRTAVLTALISFTVLYAPYLLLIPEKFLTNTVWYILKMESFKESFGLGNFSVIDILITRLTWIKEAFSNYAAVYGILGMIGISAFLKIIQKIKAGRSLKEVISPRYAGLALFILIIECFYMIPHSSGLASFTSFVFPLMVFLVAVGLKKEVWATVRETVLLGRGVVFSLLLLGLILQIPVGTQNTFAYSWSRSDVAHAYGVAQKIKSLVPPESEILTFTPIFAALADRRVIHGMEMELASFFPTWPTKKAQYHDMINHEMLKEIISSQRDSAIVLTKKRFFEDLGYARILKPYREEILSSIETHYHIVEKIEVPHSIYRGSVFIYLPKMQM